MYLSSFTFKIVNPPIKIYVVAIFFIIMKNAVMNVTFNIHITICYSWD